MRPPPPNSPLGPPFPSAQPGPFGAPGPTGSRVPSNPFAGSAPPLPGVGSGLKPPTPQRPTRKALGGSAPKAGRQKLPRTLTGGSRAGAATLGNGNSKAASPKASSTRPAAKKSTGKPPAFAPKKK
jgi:hypothetical protein